MTLYLLRHGLAASPGSAEHDRDRTLTPEGADRIALQALAFADAGIKPDHVFCSPYLRAHQTADIVSRALDAPLTEDPRLACGCTPADLLELVAENPVLNAVLVVGHQPDLGYIAQALTGKAVTVREGTLIAIEAPEPHTYRLTAVYEPDVMVSLGRTLREKSG